MLALERDIIIGDIMLGGRRGTTTAWRTGCRGGNRTVIGLIYAIIATLSRVGPTSATLAAAEKLEVLEHDLEFVALLLGLFVFPLIEA